MTDAKTRRDEMLKKCVREEEDCGCKNKCKFHPPIEEKDYVRKVDGYDYPGIVVSVFQNTKGQTRYVVECTVPEVSGMLHIFNANQLCIDWKKMLTL